VRSFIIRFIPIYHEVHQVKQSGVGGTCGTHGRGGKSVQVLVGNSEGKRPLGRLRRRWQDGIRIALRETGWRSVDWIQLAQDRGQCKAVVITVMNLRVLASQI
jgi:hypothetical protein